MEDFKSIVLNALENIGVSTNDILENNGADVDLRDYISDSISFFSFIIKIEEQLGIELSDEFLQIDKINSLNGFLEMLELTKQST